MNGAYTNTPQVLQAMFTATIAAAQPRLCMPPYLPQADTVASGKLVVIGAGKAAAAMASAVEAHWTGPLSGLVVTCYGYKVPCQHIEILEAAHPVPDHAGMLAAQRILALAERLGQDDVVLCLISGGGSALLPLPLQGVSLQDKQNINRALLACGASISEINTVRRHLSAIKGGRLAAACYPARVISLLMSDVPGDNPTDIASGPTVADHTSCADALEVLKCYQIAMPSSVHSALLSSQGESIKPDDVRLSQIETHMVITPGQALLAAAAVAKKHGYTPYILGDSIQGEAREAGKVLGSIALQTARCAQPFNPPCALLSGGETSVTLRGNGCGGRNVECLLAFALATQGHKEIYALMGDTDGVDGSAAIAGAWAGPHTLPKAFSMQLNPRAYLDNNDGHGFFQAIGDSIVTGPTLTNVNDFRVILIDRY